MRVLDSAKGTGNDTGEFYWLRCTFFIPGATLQFDNGIIIPIKGATQLRCRAGRPWHALSITGTATIEVGEAPDEDMPDGAHAPGAYDSSGNLIAALPTAQAALLASVSNPAIYDATGGVGSAVDTGILDYSLFREIQIRVLQTGGAAAVNAQANTVDDAGSSIPDNIATPSPLTSGIWSFTGYKGTTNHRDDMLTPRRGRITIPGNAGSTFRIIVYGRN